MSRQFLLAIGAGALAALFYVAVGLGSLGSLILAYLAQFPLFAIGLGAGFLHALLASGVGAVLIAAALPPSAAGLFLATAALPVLVLTNRALLSRTNPDGSIDWYPPGHLLAILNGIALAALLAVALLFWGHEGGMIGAGKELLAEMMRGFVAGEVSGQAVAAAQNRLAWLLPALVLTSWQIMVMVNGLLAQGVLSRFSLNLRPGAPFHELWLPQWLSIAFAAALVASFMPGPDRRPGRQRRDRGRAALCLSRSVGYTCAVGALARADIHPGMRIFRPVRRRLARVDRRGDRLFRDMAFPAAAVFRRSPPGRGGVMMQVILLERVEKLGQMGDVVDVKPGYARNFLLPQNKALRATEENTQTFESRRVQLEADNLERREEAEKISVDFDGLTVVLTRQASEGDQLYGSVTKRDIAEAMGAAGYTVTRNQVALDRPIKTVGLHPIRVQLHPEVAVTITANVARTKDEAEAQARGETIGADYDEDDAAETVAAEAAEDAPVAEPPAEV